MGLSPGTEGQPRSGGQDRGSRGVEAYIDEPYLNGILSGVLIGLAALWLLVVAWSLLRSGLRHQVDLQGWQVQDLFRGRIVARRDQARVVLIGGLRPQAVLYLDGKKVERRAITPELHLDTWVDSRR